jgi:sulfite exporter TauE/SafE/copper chaperone CopZ
MNKQTYYISGMHCRSCEILLEEKIGNLPGVSKVHTNHKTGAAEIFSERAMPTREAIDQAVREAGYTLGEKGQRPPLMSRNPQQYIELVFVIGVAVALYFVLKFFGLFDLDTGVGASPRLGTVIFLGVVAGLSTCMALIGGLVLGISAQHAKSHPEATRSQKFRPHIFFNLGRLLSFVLLGGLIGLLGSAFQLSGPLLGYLVIGAGIAMFLLGLKLIDIFPRLSSGFTLPKSISRLLGISRETKEYSHRGAFITGVITFFLPCGFTQAMQLYAISTGSFTRGALIMGLFALGTLPGLLGIGGLTSAIKGAFSRYFFKFAGVIVIALGALNMYGGYNLTGITFARGGDAPSIPANQIESLSDLQTLQEKITGDQSQKPVANVQVINMTQKDFSYIPNRFTIKKGVPVEWRINSTNPYTCASTIVIPALGIKKTLELGDNLVHFTTPNTGLLKFTCVMGMYSGYFNVVN